MYPDLFEHYSCGRSAIEELKASFKVESGIDVIEAEAELAHRDGYFRPDPYHDRPCSAQRIRPRDRAERARDEGVYDVKGRDIDDDAA